MNDTTTEITQLLGLAREGDAGALERVVPLLYDELRAIARQRLRGERAEHTLTPTALVHEAYLRLKGSVGFRARDRSQFFAAASETMRRVLVDYARTRKRLKRGAGAAAIPLDEVEAFLTESQAEEVLALQEPLERLAQLDERAARVVLHRFFGGLTVEETAEVLGVSPKTVKRSWVVARAWLRKEVAPELELTSAP